MKRKPRISLDLKLVGLKADTARNRFEERIKKRVEDILCRTGPYPVAESDRKEFLEFMVTKVDDWLRTLYRISGKVWVTQGGKITASFVKQTRTRVINPAIINALETVNKAFMWFQSAWTKGLCPVSSEEWSQYRSGLEDRWHRKLEIRQRELEHADRQPQSEVETICVEWVKFFRTISDELATLRREIYVEDDYGTARENHPEFKTFQITDKYPKEKDELIRRMTETKGYRGFKDLAARLTGARYKKSKDYIKIMDKRYKRIERDEARRKLM